MHRKVLLYTVAGALGLTTLACSKSTPTPASPSSAAQPETEAAPDGSTLKAATPNVQSPTGGTQATDPLTLSASRVTGRYQDVALTYQFQVRSGSTVVYDSGMAAGTVSGNNVTHVVPGSALNPDTDYTWRVRATYQDAFGSWSSDASFKSPIGAYLRGNEVRDPLTIGRTVGEIRGPVQFTSLGMKLLGKESHVLYRLEQPLEGGEFSMMVFGADEGAPGDKNKVFAMQEGPNEGDITEDDYRMTAELRGQNYSLPGAVTGRIITGRGDHFDFPRLQKDFSDERWYFWRFSWRTGVARLEVRLDSENGPALYDHTISTGEFTYRPNPHFAYLGSPAGRGGLIDATLPGGTYKNVYLGPNPRPSFPQ